MVSLYRFALTPQTTNTGCSVLPLCSPLLNTCKGFLQIRMLSEIRAFSMTTGEAFMELVFH